MARYLQADTPIDTRVEDLIARMSDAEKLAQLTCVWLNIDPEAGDFAPNPSAMALPLGRLEQVIGLGVGHVARPYGSRPITPEDGARAFNAFQKRTIETSRHRIPVLAHEEMLCGVATAGATEFPCPLNWGASFAPDLVRDMTVRIRRQALTLGIRQGLSPVADVIRDQRWGRNEECVSEDPTLVGAMVTAYVQGLQGDDWHTGVMATLKHFAGYSGSNGGRNFAPLQAGERQLREVFFPPFERAVREGRAAGVMNGYHEIDGVPCASNRWLLSTVLREQWGFDGVVVADYFAVQMLMSLHGVAIDLPQAASMTLTAGLDVELPSPQAYPDVVSRLTESPADRAALDASLRRVLTWKFRLGLFEQPFAPEGPIVLTTDQDLACARRLAEASLVLLKNTGVLPLDPAGAHRVALIGPLAEDPDASFGNYHYTSHLQSHFDGPSPVPRDRPTLLEALRQRLPHAAIEVARGCRLVAYERPRTKLAFDGEGLFISEENLIHDVSEIAAAVAIAQQADFVVLALGDRAGHFRTGSSGEGTDTDDLSLPGAQPELASAILALGKPTVVLLQNGRAFALGDVAERADAILCAWFAGEVGTAVIADAVVGAVNPGGKSPVTFPRTSGQQPRTYNAKRLDAGIPRARDYAPQFPFGHGLSYTSFEVSAATLDQAQIATDGAAVVRARVRNTGAVAGETVVQVYARDLVAQTPRPVAELKGFQRLHLEPGAAADIAFTLDADLFGYVGLDLRRIVEPGDIRLWVGLSSADTAHALTLSLTGEVREVHAPRAFSASTILTAC